MAIKQAKVSEVFPDEMAVKVTYEDRDGVVSTKLPIICRGSGTNYDFWLPDVGEQVIVSESEDGNGEGFVIGSYYSGTVPPECKSGDVRRIKFSNGDFIEHNRSNGNLTIVCSGEVTIKAAKINLN